MSKTKGWVAFQHSAKTNPLLSDRNESMKEIQDPSEGGEKFVDVDDKDSKDTGDSLIKPGFR